MNNLYCIKTTFSYILIIFLSIGYFQSTAQSPNFGNIYIASGGGMAYHNTSQNFQVGSGGALGIIGTERVSPKGYFSFVGTSIHVGAIDNAHIDGYVKTYMTTPFTFPIGDNNKYRPAAISNASINNPADAAYYGVNASTANTSSLKGGTEPVLPTGGPFNTLSIATDVKVVDNVEYWDINGTTATKITLTWNISSNISEITSNNLTALTIVGWDGTKWVKISSTFDNISLLGGSSTVSNGSITTDINIIPNAYSVYTLGVVASPDLTISIGQPVPSLLVGQPSFIPVTVTNIGTAPTTDSQTVTLQIPNGTGFGTFPVSNNGWSCSTSGLTATCVNPISIASGANSIFIVPFIATASQIGMPLTIPPAVVSGGGEPSANTGNNTSNSITTPNVGGVLILGLSKSAPSTATVGVNFSYTLTLSNTGTAGSSGNMVIKDNLPTGLAFLTGTGNEWSCSALNQWVTCNSNKAISAGGTSMVNIQVTVATPGIFSNTANVIGGGDSTTVAKNSNIVSTVIDAKGIVAAKVFLQGAFNIATGLMNDDLRIQALIPLKQPYKLLLDFNYTGTESVSPLVFTITGNNAIVDWVMLELHSALNPTTITARRAALIQRDGDIVDSDGISPVTFTNVIPGNFYISVRHQNHLGVMTSVPLSISATPAIINFTANATGNYNVSSPYAQYTFIGESSSGVKAMWAENASGDTNIIFQGPDNDIDYVFGEVFFASH